MVHTIATLAFAALLLLFAKVSCNVYAKAGFPRYFGLLLFLPGINVLILYVLAFGDWPIHKDLRR